MNIAIVGATGLAGRELVSLIHQRGFKHNKLKLFASKKSAGIVIDGETVRPIRKGMFKDIQIAFFAVDADLARKLAPEACDAGAIVIDKSSAFRMHPKVPLVIPEINGHLIHQKKLIASPNCSTTIMLMGLWPLHVHYGIKRIVVTTFQSISGGGSKLMESYEAERAVGGYCVYDDNVVPQIGDLDSCGISDEERKVILETRRIFKAPIPVSATCVRVPVRYCHSMSVNVEFESNKKVSLDRVYSLYSNQPGVMLYWNLPGVTLVGHSLEYPMPINRTRKFNVGVGRIRIDQTVHNGLQLWICGDNLWKGAALNALQIAEYIVAEGNLGR